MDLFNNFSIITYLCSIIGTTEPALRLVLCVLAGYPLGIIHRKYIYGKDANIQHLYCLLAGFTLGYFNYGCDILHSVIVMTVTYLILVIFGGTVLAVALTFIFNMVYLLVGYSYAATDNYDINWTIPQCVLVLRLIGLAFDVKDGKELRESSSSSTDNKKAALHQIPTFLETCAFVYFPGSFFVGPQFPMKRYQEFVEGKYSDGDKKIPPNSVPASLQQFLVGISYLIVYQLLSNFVVNDEYVLSNKFDDLSLLKKLFVIGLYGKCILYKYISCWKLTEGACSMFGITYNGKDEKDRPLWNGVENVKIGILENATEMNHYIQSFNTNTNHWAAQYIYKRLKFLGNRFISQGATLLFLAIWHGLHSGYYLTFVTEFVIMYMEKDIKHLVQSNEKVYNFLNQQPCSIIVNILLRMYTITSFGWGLVPFDLMKFERYWKVYSSMYYIGFFVFCLYPIIYRPILRMLLKSKKPVHKD